MRRGIDPSFNNFPIVRLFVSPLDNISINIFFENNFSMNLTKIVLLLLYDVHITSMSPEFSAFRL